jgi:enoyl-CoA hydratase/carnithine racemase
MQLTPASGLQTLSVTREESIVHVRLERPEKLNAQTPQMWFELRQVGEELGEDRTVRALVVSGAGRSFSAGLDTSVLMGTFGGEVPRDLVELSGPSLVRKVQGTFEWLTKTPYPTIAAVQGHALGAGFQLALACDLRIAADNATFGLLETNWGLMPDLGGTAWLPPLVGPAKAKELMWLAQRIDSVESQRLGIVNRVVAAADLENEVRVLATALASRPPLAVEAIKRSVDAANTGTDDALESAAEGQFRCLRSQDFVEAGKASLEQRAPSYTGT